MSVRDWAPFGRQRTYSGDGLDEVGFVDVVALGALAIVIALGIWALF